MMKACYRKNVVEFFVIVLFSFVLCSCGSGGGGGSDSSNSLKVPEGFPIPRVPAENPITENKVKLGRYLFYDTSLSGNREQACASCHKQEHAFSSEETTAVGSTGQHHPRNANTLVNAAYNSALTWSNPNLLTIERQIFIPLFSVNPIELGALGKEEEILQRFKGNDSYRQMFQEAFPDEEEPVTFNSIIFSLASFVRTLNSGNSPYDKFVAGDDSQLSPSAKRGLDLFSSERLECYHCHGGFNFTHSSTHTTDQSTSNPFHNTGLYNIGGTGAYPADNQGIYEFTRNLNDMGKFRAPSLRNVEVSAPYMHDGSMKTLEEVVDFYARGGRNITAGPFRGDGRENPYKSGFVAGFSLTQSEKEDLISFLKSLTDHEFLTNSALSNPNSKK
jgi:cytochrome c peroxidase